MLSEAYNFNILWSKLHFDRKYFSSGLQPKRLASSFHARGYAISEHQHIALGWLNVLKNYNIFLKEIIVIL